MPRGKYDRSKLAKDRGQAPSKEDNAPDTGSVLDIDEQPKAVQPQAEDEQAQAPPPAAEIKQEPPQQPVAEKPTNKGKDMEAPAQPGIPASVIAQVIEKMTPQKEKPTFASQADIAEDDWTHDTMRVIMYGKNRLFAHFLVGGRAVECPRSKIIQFSPHYTKDSTVGGIGGQMSFQVIYITNSKKEQELFRKDDRLGKLFYIDEGTPPSKDGLLRMRLYTNAKRAVDAMNINDVRNRYVANGGKLGVPAEDMRISLAEAMADSELRGMRENMGLAEAEARKGQILQNG